MALGILCNHEASGTRLRACRIVEQVDTDTNVSLLLQQHYDHGTLSASDITAAVSSSFKHLSSDALLVVYWNVLMLLRYAPTDTQRLVCEAALPRS